MKVCVPVTDDGQIDPRWGRAHTVAIAEVEQGQVRDWQEVTVAWDRLHDEGTEGAHHARVATFLREHKIEAVGVNHVGPGMQRMLATMGVRVVDGLDGDPRQAAAHAAG